MATTEAARPIALAAPSGRRWRRVVTRSVLPRVVLILGCLVFLAPFYWMVISALKTNAELTQFPPSLIPGAWAFNNFPGQAATCFSPSASRRSSCHTR